MSGHVCDPQNPDCAAYLHYADPANRESADGSRALARRRTGTTVEWVELPSGAAATAHTFTAACAGHHPITEPCPET